MQRFFQNYKDYDCDICWGSQIDMFLIVIVVETLERQQKATRLCTQYE